jgi:hypothetical protein
MILLVPGKALAEFKALKFKANLGVPIHGHCAAFCIPFRGFYRNCEQLWGRRLEGNE